MTKKEKVFQLISNVPVGKVTTYGQLAIMVGTGPRVVGKYLHENLDPKQFPCHRVVHADGTLAVGYAFGGLGKQKEILEKEGIDFRNEKIDMKVFGWVPV